MKCFDRKSLMAFVLAVNASLLLAQSPPVTNGLKVWLNAVAITGLNDGDTVSSWPDLAVNFHPPVELPPPDMADLTSHRVG